MLGVALSAQRNETAPARGGRAGGRGSRGEELVPTALISERNLTATDFPTLKSTTGDVYVWQDVNASGVLINSLVVITDDGVLIADGQRTPDATRKMLDAIHLLTTQPIKYIVRASDDGDHAGGNGAFPRGATFISSSASPDTRTIRMGGTEIRILRSGRGHGAGDLQVYLPQEKVLFTGETFAAHVFPEMSSAFPSDWIQTVKKLRQIDATFIVPGHGFLDPVPNMSRELGEFEAALEYVVGEVIRIQRGGASVDETLARASWGPYAAWSLAERHGPIAVRRVYDQLNGKLP
jgi:glyoxylase-like metal-dependent hydrolase (beta-lactamase superfamily II)